MAVLRCEQSCCIVDGVVVVVAVDERSLARAINVGAGADAPEGRTVELLKVAASGRGIVPSCNTVLPPGRGVARRRGECRSVVASGGSMGNFNARRWGTTCQAVLLLVVVVEEREFRTML